MRNGHFMDPFKSSHDICASTYQRFRNIVNPQNCVFKYYFQFHDTKSEKRSLSLKLRHNMMGGSCRKVFEKNAKLRAKLF